jgi:hypothetical protein
LARPGVSIAAIVLALAAVVAGSAAGEDPVLRSRLVWSEAVEGFGGFSGIELTDDGRAFLAISDRGLLMKASIDRAGDGTMTAVALTGALRLNDNAGRPVAGFHSDAEAIRVGPGGSVLIAFEGYARVASFRLPDPTPRALHFWDRFETLWGNEGMESLAIDARGQIMTILERPLGDGAYRTLLYRGGVTWEDGPHLASDGDLMAADADFGPDGRLYLLERGHSLIWGFRSRISVYARDGDLFVRDETVLDTASGAFGDLEGIDVWTDSQGRTIATLISDSNFAPGAPSEIVELQLAP